MLGKPTNKQTKTTDFPSSTRITAARSANALGHAIIVGAAYTVLQHVAGTDAYLPLQVAIKAIPTLLCALVAYWNGASLLVAGFLFGAIGDIALIKPDDYFIIGMMHARCDEMKCHSRFFL